VPPLRGKENNWRGQGLPPKREKVMSEKQAKKLLQEFSVLRDKIRQEVDTPKETERFFELYDMIMELLRKHG
jgi:hypothetical protein